VKGFVDAVVGFVIEDRVGTGDDARGAAGTQSRGHDLAKELTPLRFLCGHATTLGGTLTRRSPVRFVECPKSSKWSRIDN